VQTSEYLRIRGFDFEPDLVMIYHGYNDFLPRVYLQRRVAGLERSGSEPTDLQLVRMRRRPMYEVTGWLFEHSILWRWLSKLAHAGGRPAPPPEAGPTGPRGGPRVPESERREVLAEILERTRAHSAELLVLVPVYRRFDRHRETLLAFARENGLHVMDLEEAVRAMGAPRDELFVDAAHPAPRLHRAIAEQIAAGLREEVLGN